MYIDQTYYMDEYYGEPTEDFDKYEQRASDEIDRLTSYRVKQNGLESLTDFQQDLFKKAVASLVEDYAVNGLHSESLQSVNIGSFSYTEGGSVASIGKQALTYLNDSGLLYRGLRTW